MPHHCQMATEIPSSFSPSLTPLWQGFRTPHDNLVRTKSQVPFQPLLASRDHDIWLVQHLLSHAVSAVNLPLFLVLWLRKNKFLLDFFHLFCAFWHFCFATFLATSLENQIKEILEHLLLCCSLGPQVLILVFLSFTYVHFKCKCHRVQLCSHPQCPQRLSSWTPLSHDTKTCGHSSSLYKVL